jgi:RimJ/RimL family protein N-acetyltransferase
MPGGELQTARLRLRRWRPSDDDAMQAINRDPDVARYLNRPTTGPAIRDFFELVADHWRVHGFGLYAVETRIPGEPETFIGFVGIAYPTFLPSLAHRPELGWRLARWAWGQGLATEAAIAARDHGFGQLGLHELISIIHPQNERSQRVAIKVGMTIQSQVFNPVLKLMVDVWQVNAGGGEPR